VFRTRARSQTNAAAALTYNGAVTMDPSSLTARAHVVDVVTDITDRYDIDGVVFDDYFYPYPQGHRMKSWIISITYKTARIPGCPTLARMIF